MSTETVTLPRELVEPFLRFIETNDGDTLASLRKDEERVAVASGSWSHHAPITIGDFRKLRDHLAQPQGPTVTELLAAIREHKLDVAMADADTHKADRKLWSHLPDEADPRADIFPAYDEVEDDNQPGGRE